MAISRAASVFVLHATTYANQAAVKARRRTLTAQDVIAGVKELDLHDFVHPLQTSLEAWKEAQAAKKAAKTGPAAAAIPEEVTLDDDGDEPPPGEEDDGDDVQELMEEEEEGDESIPLSSPTTASLAPPTRPDHQYQDQQPDSPDDL